VPPSSLPFDLLPIPLQETGFIALFYIGTWSPPTILPHLNLLSSPFLAHTSITDTIPILQSSLPLLISKSMFKGVSQCVPTVSILYFGPFNPFHWSLLPLYLPLPIIQHLPIHIIVSSTWKDVIYFNIVESFSFPFPAFLNSREVPLLQTHLHISLHMIMFVFVYMVIF
jgi:hypothetical protein